MNLKINARSLIRYWELTMSLATKDLKVRYKSPALGFLWAILVPILMAIIFIVIFSRVFKISIKDYPVFLICGLFPWNFFQLSISTGTTSIVENGGLLKKVYFPRQVIPLSIVAANLVNFLLALILLIIIVLIFRLRPGMPVLLLPVAIMLQVILTTGILLIFSSLHTYYRDVRYIVEVLLICWFYLTPIFYDVTTVIPERYIKIYMLNPMAGIVTIYRDIFIYSRFPEIHLFLNTLLTSLLFLVLGIFTFKRYERNLSDII